MINKSTDNGKCGQFVFYNNKDNISVYLFITKQLRAILGDSEAKLEINF